MERVPIRIQRAGKGGKTVTVIEKLPRSRPYLETLARTLKNRAGSGGTYGVNRLGGFIEIQGDKRERLRQILSDEGIEVRG